MNRQRGSVGIIAAAGTLLVLVIGLLLTDVAHTYTARASLATAADAAALAAAPVTFSSFGTDGNPWRAAAEMAAANGAELIACECSIDRSWSTRRVAVTVAATVDLSLLGDRRMTAMAAAEFRPVDLGRNAGGVDTRAPPSR
ncbi:MAG: hypothetical protein GY788_03835 [bacterium]|nr:hypothetical protein [bacterium]